MQPLPPGSATKRSSLLMATHTGLLSFKYSAYNWLKNFPLRIKSCSLRLLVHTISWLHLSITRPLGYNNCPSFNPSKPVLCTSHFQNRPPPSANPRAFDFSEKFWSNSLECCQFRRLNAPSVRASKRVKSFIQMYIFCNKQLATVWINNEPEQKSYGCFTANIFL